MSNNLPSPPEKRRDLQDYRDFLAMADIDASELPSSWVRSEGSRRALASSLWERQKRHSLYATIPIKCRGELCPYADVCPLIEEDEAPVGELCPLETSLILKRSMEYMRELEIDDEKVVDLGLLRDLIDCEVQIDRCDRLLSKDGTIIQQVDVGVTPDGVLIQRPELHQALLLKEKMQKRKNEILRLLNSTRQDHAKQDAGLLDPSSHATKIARMYEKMKELIEGNMTVVEADVVEEIDRKDGVQ